MAVLPVEQGVGALDHGGGHAHARGHGRRRRRPGRAELEAVGGRERLRVELDARVAEALVDLGHLLQQVVVGRDDHPGSAVGELLQYGLCDRGALSRVRSDPDLVEHHQRAPRRFAYHGGEVGHVRREGRQVLADVLFVADVGQQRVDERDPGARVRGHVQPRPQLERGQRDGLHRDRLAAGVRSGDDEHVEVCAEFDVVGHALRRGDQGVPDSAQRESAVAVGRRLHAVHGGRQLAPRQREVDLDQHGEGRAQRWHVLGELAGQPPQHPLDLPGGLELRLLELVVEPDHALGFDEQGRAAVRRVVDDAAHPAAHVGPHGQDIAIVADGDEVIGERRADVVVAQHPVESLAQVAREPRALGARVAERGRGAFAHLAARVDAALDFARELSVVPDGVRQVAQQRCVVRGLRQPAAGLAQRGEGARDIAESVARQRAALLGAGEALCQAGAEGAEPGGPFLVDESARFGREVESFEDGGFARG